MVVPACRLHRQPVLVEPLSRVRLLVTQGARGQGPARSVRGAFASRQQNDPTIGIFGVLSVFKEFQAHARHGVSCSPPRRKFSVRRVDV